MSNATSGLNLSRQLKAITRNYRFAKDAAGMSPARVYRLIGRRENLYLKVSDTQYRGTTYDVEREKDLLLWLRGKLPVPEVLHFEQYQNASFLLMREVPGLVGSAYAQEQRDPQKMTRIYAEGIRLLQSVDISDCPFSSDIDFRLSELNYLLENNLADTDLENWEADTPFSDPHELYAFLKSHKPTQEWTFSHGDFGDSNIFITDDRISGFIDLGRSGKADKWCDIAFCVRSIQHDMDNPQAHLDLLFSLLQIEPDWEKIRYHILLDELF